MAKSSIVLRVNMNEELQRLVNIIRGALNGGRVEVVKDVVGKEVVALSTHSSEQTHTLAHALRFLTAYAKLEVDPAPVLKHAPVLKTPTDTGDSNGMGQVVME